MPKLEGSRELQRLIFGRMTISSLFWTPKKGVLKKEVHKMMISWFLYFWLFVARFLIEKPRPKHCIYCLHRVVIKWNFVKTRAQRYLFSLYIHKTHSPVEITKTISSGDQSKKSHHLTPRDCQFLNNSRLIEVWRLKQFSVL